MSFLEVQFPTDVSFGSSGGPMFVTEILPYGVGHEQRNIRQPNGLNQFNAAYGAKTQAQIESVVTFFRAVRGRAHGFRYVDPVDYKSGLIDDDAAFGDQIIGTGNGVEDEFQLVKKYTEGGLTETRNIKKPVSGTVLIGVDGVQRLTGDATYPWSVDTTTGIVTFTGTLPPASLVITAGYQYDNACRFGVDKLQISIDNRNQGAGYIVNADIPIVEIMV